MLFKDFNKKVLKNLSLNKIKKASYNTKNIS